MNLNLYHVFLLVLVVHDGVTAVGKMSHDTRMYVCMYVCTVCMYVCMYVCIIC